jgi:hypothetical protein
MYADGFAADIKRTRFVYLILSQCSLNDALFVRKASDADAHISISQSVAHFDTRRNKSRADRIRVI